MTNLLKWNMEYITTHRLADIVLAAAGIEKKDKSEIFVEHPEYKDYYVSQYGRAISLKRNTVKLLKAFMGGQSNRRYWYYGFEAKDKPHTISMNRAVADVFCPNFWGNAKRLEAHHINGNKLDNDYRNLILLTTKLHNAIHDIKKIVWLKDGMIKEYPNPLDLVYDTGLTLEDILLANKGKKKPLKSEGKYTIFEIKGHLIGFQYYPKTPKKK